jgi:hypothetical protein
VSEAPLEKTGKPGGLRHQERPAELISRATILLSERFGQGAGRDAAGEHPPWAEAIRQEILASLVPKRIAGSTRP